MPILNVQRRLVQVGRLRLGQKGPKGEPQKLDVWRATSASEELIEKIAEVYGGEVSRWKPSASAASQFQVITEARELDVTVMPNQVISQFFELWGGGGCLRRCDGETDILNDIPCQCPVDPEVRKAQAVKGKACWPTTRVSVMLNAVPRIGLWRVDSHGDNAMCEIAGAAELLDYASQQGIFLPAVLTADSRTSKVNGRTVHFVVPVLTIKAGFNDVAKALGIAPVLQELNAGPEAPRALEVGPEPVNGYVQPNGHIHVPEDPPKAPVTVVNRSGFPVPKPVALTAPAPAVEPEPPLPGDEGVDLAFAEIEDADIVEEEECPPGLVVSVPKGEPMTVPVAATTVSLDADIVEERESSPSAPVMTAPKATTAPVPVTTASQNAPGLKPTIPLSTVSFSTSSFVPAVFVEAQLGVAPSLGGPPISGGKGKETTPTPPKKNIGMGPKAKETMAKRAAPMKAALSSESSTPTATPPSESSTPRETSAPSAAADAIRKGIVIAAKDSDIDDTLRHEACLYISEGRSEHAVDMTEKEAQALYALFSGIRRKKITVEYSPDGVVSFL